MGMSDQSVKAQVFEPVLPMDSCEVEIVDAVRHDWKRPAEEGKTTLGMKLTMRVVDPEAKCENVDAKPGQIVDYINLEVHPPQAEGKRATYISKALSLMQAIGFEPSFVDDDGNGVEPKITRNGNKVAPPGAHTKFNPEFIEAYFDKDADGNEAPKFGVWSGVKIKVKLDVEKNEEYGDKNRVVRYLVKKD